MPERFLLQILRVLVNHGILRSTRGVEGGYALVKSPDEISLLEVIEAIDGPLDDAGEHRARDGDAEAGSVQDNLQTALRQVTRTARKQLKAITLSQLLEPPPAADTPSPTGGSQAP
jgi:Rrf2 family protein